MAEWKQNIPHIIALALLLFALLIVLTRVGIVGCSTFGTSYCNVYYGIFGKPKIAIVYDPNGPGIGDPTALARYLEDVKHINVQEITVDQLSAGMLNRYDVVIVEHARDIPTSKLKLFYNYVINDMGRLVWVGDSGTTMGARDSICRTMEYTVQWATAQGVRRTTESKKICVGPGDLDVSGNITTSEFSLDARSALYQKAWDELSNMCHDAFGGTLSNVKYAQGYPCQDVSKGYSEVYFNWINENDFKQAVSPWNRGVFKLLGEQSSLPGVHFGTDILGVTFISDAYAVQEYAAFSKQINQLRQIFANAHSALLNCSSSYSGGCNRVMLESKLSSARDSLNDEIGSVKLKLSSDISELQSIEQQEKLKNQTTQALRIMSVINILSNKKDSINYTNLSFLDTAQALLSQAAGYETDSTVRDQLRSLASSLSSYKKSIENAYLSVEEDQEALKNCRGGGMLEKYSERVGVPENVMFVLTSLSNQPSDDDLLDFIAKARSGYFDNALAKLSSDESCSASKYFAQAIRLAKTLHNPAANNTAVAVLKVEDPEHPLVQGIAQSIELVDKYGHPVPFTLVATGNEYTHVVASLSITPEYKGEKLWPAITVRDPKYGTHVFGRGVVVYYAFPPEISPVLMDNLLKFILY